ncbi:MAG: hypothetical protein QJR03_07580 [Sphaerobacter sp.]|nr:hypothetical protein [Sphaerobacter sp.]
MDETARAFLIWVPAGTLLPFLVSRLTGADWRSSTIEAALFAALGLLIYPTMLALIVVHIVGYPNVELLFLAGFALAALTVVGYRRGIAGGRPRY